MERENLISYAANFVSFLLDEKIAKHINRIVLFGSVARGNFDKESDIDVFIDTKKEIGNDVQGILSMFNQTETQKSGS